MKMYNCIQPLKNNKLKSVPIKIHFIFIVKLK